MRQALGMCFNWKVLAVLAAVAVAVLVLASGAALAVLPLLILAACPLSMGAMMWAMRGHGSGPGGSCHPAENEASVEAKQARLRELRDKEQRLELELSAATTADSTDVPAASPATAVAPQGGS